MNMKLNVCGIKYEVQELSVGGLQIFGGVHQIIVAALKREQENRYRIFVVCENEIIDKTVCRLDVAVTYLQNVYDERGRI